MLVGLLALGSARAASAAPAELISFGTTTCAPGWQAPNPGIAHFRIVNGSSRPATVYLFHADSGAVVATLTGLGAGRSSSLTTHLSRGGLYAWSCDLRGYPIHVSDTQKVPDVSTPGGMAPTVVPVQPGELITPLQAYRGYARATLDALSAQLRTLAGDIAAGEFAQAEQDWLSAHLSWLDLGQDDGAYGAFGDLGNSIDGTAAGLPAGTASARFTGFHKIEFDLWQKHSLTAAAADTAHLQSLVSTITARRLIADTPTDVTGLTTFSTRVHEVLEDALRDTLSDDDDYGSGTGLASLTADVSATREFLTLLAPLLAPRAPYVVGRARAELTALLEAVASTRVNGAWVAVDALPERQRELIDARTGATLQTLARIPGILALGGS